MRSKVPVGQIVTMTVLVVGLAFGLWQVKQSQDIKKSSAAGEGGCTSKTTAQINVNGSGWTNHWGLIKAGDVVQFRAAPANGRTVFLLNTAGQVGGQCSSDPGAGLKCPGAVAMDSWWGNYVSLTITVKAFEFKSNWYTSPGGNCEDSLVLTIVPVAFTPPPSKK